MPQLFLSHSSQNNPEAIALRDWLRREGWDDVFLDVDAHRGIAAGERWERALTRAALRCEAVLFLVSREWLASGWCLKEFGLAHKLNKQLFGLIIDDLHSSDLPVNLASTWQTVSLSAGSNHEPFTVSLPFTGAERLVTFSREGLARLRTGLRRAGLDPSVFAWPPQDDPDRPPYPGLRPLDVEDAGIFFGREAPTIEALDRMRALRDTAAPRLLCVLGASGSGKSSFLRAGLWPRLARDDRNFLPLPVLRPERAAIAGPAGLIAVLLAAFAARGLPISRNDIRRSVRGGAVRLRPLLRQLTEHAAAALIGENEEASARLPLLVLPIDQGEELCAGTGPESAELLALLRQLLDEDDPPLAALLTIRSDSFERLQVEPALEGVTLQTMTFSPLSRGIYATLIEAPAARLREADRRLDIEPALTRAILADMDEGGGADALPLLAFTMERLWLEYGGSGRLALADYEALGRVRGSIEAAVEAALAAAEHDPRLPREPAARLVLLRRGLIPWLAGIDPDNGRPRRRVARRSEIPEEARPLVDLLVEQRLLSSDLDPATGEATIEPAHEALLRQWGLLEGWLKADFAALATLEGVRRATRDWNANARAPDWLAHGAARLEDAERLRGRPDLAAHLGPGERDYLQACRSRADREAANERQRARQRRWLLWGSLAAFCIFIVLGTFAGWQNVVLLRQTEKAAKSEKEAYDQTQRAEVQERRAGEEESKAKDERLRADQARKSLEVALRGAQLSESRSIAEEALRQAAAGDTGAAIRTALSALPADLDHPDRPFVVRAHSALLLAVAQDRLARELRPSADQVNHAGFSPDGTLVATSTRDGIVSLWEAATGVLRRRFDENRSAAFLTVFSPDGTRIATAYQNPNSIVVRDTRDGSLVQDLRHPGGNNLGVRLAFTADGTGLVSVGGLTDGDVRAWDLASGRQVASLVADHTFFSVPSGLGYERGGRYLSLRSTDGMQIWDVASRKTFLSSLEPVTAALDARSLFKPSAETVRIRAAAFLADGRRLVLRTDTTLYILSLPTRQVESSWAFWSDRGLPGNDTLLVTPDERQAVVPVSPTELGILDLETGRLMQTLRGHTAKVTTAAMSRDGRVVAALAEDGSVRVFDLRTGQQRHVFKVESETIRDFAFSPIADLLMTYGGPTVRFWHVGDRSDHDRPAGLGAKWSVAKTDSAGARALVVTGESRYDQDRKVGLFDLEAGRHLSTFEALGWAPEVDKAAFSPSGRVLAMPRLQDSRDRDNGEALFGRTASGGDAPYRPPSLGVGKLLVELRDAGTGQPLGWIASDLDNLEAVALSPDDRFLCLADGEYSADRSRFELFRIADGVRVAAFEQPGGRDPRCAFDGSKFSAISRHRERGVTIGRWDLASGRKLTELAFPDSDGFAVQPVDGGRRLLVASETHQPALLDAASGEAVPAFVTPMTGVERFETGCGSTRALLERRDKSWALWDLAERRKVVALDPGPGGDLSLAGWSDDRQRFLMRHNRSSGSVFRVHEAGTGRLVKECGPYEARYLNSAFGGAGKLAAVALDARTIELCDVDGSRPPVRVTLDGTWKTLLLAAGDERLLSATGGGIVELRDTRTGARLARIEGAAQEKAVTLADPDGRFGLVRLRGGGARLIDTQTGSLAWDSAGSYIADATVLPGERNLLVVRPDRVELVGLADRAVRAEYPFDAKPFSSFEPTPDGDGVVVFARGGRSLLVRTRPEVSFTPFDKLNVLVAGRNGAGWVAFGGPEGVDIVEATSGRVLHHAPTSTLVNEIRASAGSDAVLAATNDGTILTVNAASGAVASLGKMSGLKSVAFGAKPDEVLVHDGGGLLGIYRIGDPKPQTVFQEAGWGATPITKGWRVQADPTGTLFGVCDPDNFLRIHRSADGVLVSWFYKGDAPCADTLLLGPTSAVSVRENARFEFLDIKADKVTRGTTLSGTFSRFSDRSLASGGPRLVAISKDGIVTTLSTAIDDPQIFSTGAAAEDMAAALSRDGALLATFDKSGTLRVWDTATRSVVEELRLFGAKGDLYDPVVRFSRDGRRLVLETHHEAPEIAPVPLTRAALMAKARAIVGAGAPVRDAAAPAGKLRLGVVMSDLSPADAERLGLPDTQGAFLTEVVPDSPAFLAGLAPGDVVLRLGDKTLSGSADLSAVTAAANPGDSLTAEVLRSGERLSFTVHL